MYKLTIVSGPNRGSSFALKEGENTIGRQPGNSVVLSSSRVSKQHCRLVVDNDRIVVRDQGSANGTFVNGVLSKEKQVAPGDRISVGNFVLEVSDPRARALQAPPAANVIQFPMVPASSAHGSLPGMGPGMSEASASGNEPPKDLPGKILWAFDQHVMTLFYGLNLKHEWKYVASVLFAGYVVAMLLVSIQPVLDSGQITVVEETSRRASFMAKEIAARNAPLLAARSESKTEVSPQEENAEGVRMAVLTDLKSRVLAPASRMNTYLVSGPEAKYVAKARVLFENGRETGKSYKDDPSAVTWVEPVRVLSTAEGRNVTVGMAVVSIDATLFTPGMGELGLIYSQSFIVTAALGALILLILYRLTIRPFSVLNEDLDKALKGDIAQVTHEYKFEETNSLWDLINSALQRLPKGSDGAGGGMGANPFGELPSMDEFLGPLRQLGAFAGFGLLVCDSARCIAYMNPAFEDLSGLHLDGTVGQDVSSVARDQSLGAFMADLMDRAASSPEGASEDYEFSGVQYKVHASVFGTPQLAKCYLVAVVKGEG